MSVAVYHFVSGTSLFSGAALLGAAIGAGVGARGALARAGVDLLSILGAAFILLSSSPLPPGLYAAVFTVVLLWSMADRFRGVPCRLKLGLRLAALAGCATLVLLELPYHRDVTIPQAGHRRVVVVGDSISAGIGVEGGRVWPEVLRTDHGVSVINLAVAGATLSTAISQADRLPKGPSVVVLEIGGNDLIGGASAEQFAGDLEALLRRVVAPDRTVLMFELPLTPFMNGFGHAQRRLAKAHGVSLIPKRHFARILTTPDYTVDGLHLSVVGHEQLADMIWQKL